MDTEIKEANPSIPNWKHLKEYTDKELFSYLENNEMQDVRTLVYMCSEVLRRQLMQSFSVESSTSSNQHQ
jgi:hypothetical protein